MIDSGDENVELSDSQNCSETVGVSGADGVILCCDVKSFEASVICDEERSGDECWSDSGDDGRSLYVNN